MGNGSLDCNFLVEIKGVSSKPPKSQAFCRGLASSQGYDPLWTPEPFVLHIRRCSKSSQASKVFMSPVSLGAQRSLRLLAQHMCHGQSIAYLGLGSLILAYLGKMFGFLCFWYLSPGAAKKRTPFFFASPYHPGCEEHLPAHRVGVSIGKPRPAELPIYLDYNGASAGEKRRSRGWKAAYRPRGSRYLNFLMDIDPVAQSEST